MTGLCRAEHSSDLARRPAAFGACFSGSSSVRPHKESAPTGEYDPGKVHGPKPKRRSHDPPPSSPCRWIRDSHLSNRPCSVRCWNVTFLSPNLTVDVMVLLRLALAAAVFAALFADAMETGGPQKLGAEVSLDCEPMGTVRIPKNADAFHDVDEAPKTKKPTVFGAAFTQNASTVFATVLELVLKGNDVNAEKVFENPLRLAVFYQRNDIIVLLLTMYNPENYKDVIKEFIPGVPIDALITWSTVVNRPSIKTILLATDDYLRYSRNDCKYNGKIYRLFFRVLAPAIQDNRDADGPARGMFDEMAIAAAKKNNVDALTVLEEFLYKHSSAIDEMTFPGRIAGWTEPMGGIRMRKRHTIGLAALSRFEVR